MERRHINTYITLHFSCSFLYVTVVIKRTYYAHVIHVFTDNTKARNPVERIGNTITPTTGRLSAATLILLDANYILRAIFHTCFIKRSNQVSEYLK
jgi:hypothetical protein